MFKVIHIRYQYFAIFIVCAFIIRKYRYIVLFIFLFLYLSGFKKDTLQRICFLPVRK